jgi:hypothetical protein
MPTLREIKRRKLMSEQQIQQFEDQLTDQIRNGKLDDIEALGPKGGFLSIVEELNPEYTEKGMKKIMIVRATQKDIARLKRRLGNG